MSIVLPALHVQIAQADRRTVEILWIEPRLIPVDAVQRHCPNNCRDQVIPVIFFMGKMMESRR